MLKSILWFVLIPLLCVPQILQADCNGRCGDANADSQVGIRNAVYIINDVFPGGDTPQPVGACADANGDCKVNVSDAIAIVRYVFPGGLEPAHCCDGGWENEGGDCCPYPYK